MQNLKVTIRLNENGAILDRFLSIDSILLFQHYKHLKTTGKMPREQFVETKDDLDNLSNWIAVENGSISGSIWYVADDALVQLWNVPVRKSTNVNEVYKVTGKAITTPSKPSPQSGELKRFDLAFETIKVDKVHFYVRGDKEYITMLCKQLKYIGKKSSIGYGWVENVQVDEVNEDKSFMLDAYTPSKPLPCVQNEIESHKVAFYRSLPPYSSKEDQEPCYMPTTSLIERSDNSRKNKNFTAMKDTPFISNPKFLHDALKSSTKFNFDELSVGKGIIKFDKESSQGCCAACGAETKRGIVGDLKKYFGANFNDFPAFGKTNILCEDCMWSTKSDSEKLIGFTHVYNNTVTHVQGSKMEVFSEKKSENTKLQSKYRKDLIENLRHQKIPFSLNWKTTTNTQHVSFKGKVSISNAMIVFNYGDSGTEFIDVELMNEALEDMIKLMEETSTNKKKDNGFKKTHLLNVDGYKGNMSISKELDTFKNRMRLSGFYRKYDKSIRKALHKVTF